MKINFLRSDKVAKEFRFRKKIRGAKNLVPKRKGTESLEPQCIDFYPGTHFAQQADITHFSIVEPNQPKGSVCRSHDGQCSD